MNYKLSHSVKFILIYLCFAFSLSAIAEDKVFIAKAGNPTIAIAAVKSSFLKRRWQVIAEDTNSITGELNHRNHEAKLTISYKEGVLYYQCLCFKIVDSDYEDDDETKLPYEPARWINNLRRDTEISLVNSFKYNTSQATEAKNTNKSVTERLKTLKQLLDEQLISAEEYNEKRQALLSEL